MSEKLTIALAGNPNSGKTTIFNGLTGTRQHTGNYPGVTVEWKHGCCRHNGVEIEVADLPGTYSLTAYSIEELVARHYILDRQPDVLVDIVDAANLERNLYLAVQFMELGAPLVLAFNMSDVAKARGIEFDLPRLGRLLGTPIVPTVGSKGQGLTELMDEVVGVARRKQAPESRRIHYGPEIEEELDRIEKLLAPDVEACKKYGGRWLAIKLLENDKEVRELVTDEAVHHQVELSSRHLEGILGERPELAIAGRRYGFISGACQEAVRTTVETRHTISDKIDAVLTNRVVGLPIFLALMYVVFQLVFAFGDYPMGWLESFFGWAGGTISQFWPRGSESILRSLLVDGVIGGVGGVISFLPNILLLFAAIAFLEDSGYMARAAFLMDRLMHKIGLHGKSFIPMLIGFGCSVPAIMATRTLDSRRDRLATMLILPLMSCGARLTIYALIIPAFFARAWQAPMLWLIYLIGIVLAIVCAKLLRATVLRGEAPPFVMELPLYRLPTLRGLLIHMWDRGWMYVRKAGTIILGISIILWALTTFPKKAAFDRDYDAEADRARAAFLAEVRQHDPAGLEKVIAAELDAAERQGKFWEYEEGFAKAEQAKAAAIAEAVGDPAGPLGRFLDVRRKAIEQRRQFDDAIEDHQVEKGTPEYAALVHARHDVLMTIEKADPETYAAVVAYLDEIHAPYVEQAEERANARQTEELSYTVAGRIGAGLAPAIRPLGFDWRIGTALIGAFAAKEVFVAQMGIVFSVGEADESSDALRQQLQARYSKLQAFCIMLFCLISAPCVATIAVTKKESGSWKWAAFQVGGLTALAYLLTLAVYQIGSLVS